MNYRMKYATNRIRFYDMFSWWMFIWFILYELNIVKYEPSFSYIFSIIFNTILTIYFIFTTNVKRINYKVLFIKLFIWFLLDVFPVFILYPFTLNYSTLIVNIIVFCVYLLFMNINIVNILRIYYTSITRVNNYTFKEYIDYLKYFFLYT